MNPCFFNDWYVQALTKKILGRVGIGNIRLGSMPAGVAEASETSGFQHIKARVWLVDYV